MNPQNSSTIVLNLNELSDLNYIQGLSAAISAAHTSGLTDALLDGGEATASAWAERAKLTTRGARLLLDVLVSVGMVDQGEGGQYGVSARFKEQCAFARTMNNTQPLIWGALPGWLQTGEPLLLADFGGSERVYAEIARILALLAAEPARVLAEHISDTKGDVLDVGCGAGPWSLALAQRSPNVMVTGLDQPEVVECFMEHARERGLLAQARALGGDMFDAEVGQGAYDLVMIGQVLRILSPARARALIHRMATAIKPGGTMVIIDAFPGTAATSRRRHAVYALHLAVRSAEGEVHSEPSVRGWLEEAGLSDVERLCLGEASPVNALRARQPQG